MKIRGNNGVKAENADIRGLFDVPELRRPTEAGRAPSHRMTMSIASPQAGRGGVRAGDPAPGPTLRHYARHTTSHGPPHTKLEPGA